MKKPTRARARTRSVNEFSIRKTAASSLALSAIFTANAYADPQAAEAPASTGTTNDEPLEEVLVSGIRHAIAASLEVKREEMSIVEVVSAEEIGKLPDVSIAESIARLPGLAAQRINGRAQSISIRGLAPDFTTTLLNGRQQASSGDNRAVEFDQYPSELLQSVVIYKTPDANISGFGLSGTADLRTVRPLDFQKRTIAVNIRGELGEGGQMNDDVRNYGGRLSGSYIDQNDDGTVGWAVGYAHLDSPSKNQHTKLYNFETFGDPSRAALINPDDADDATYVTGQEIFATSRSNRRDAVIGILEFKPNERVHSTFDLYYSKFDQTEVMRGAQWFSNVWADAQTYEGVTTEDLGGTKFAVTGEATGVAPIIRNDYNTRSDELIAAGFNQRFDINEDWSLNADLSYSRNKRDESITETYAGYGTGANAATQNDNRVFDDLTWDFVGDVPQWESGLNYADSSQVSLGDRAPWGGWAHDGQTKQPHVEESITAAELGVERKFESFFNNIDVGVNYTRRDKDKRVGEFDEMLKDDRTQSLVDASDLVKSTSLAYAGFGDVLSVNLRSALPKYYDRTIFINGDTYNKAWGLTEDVITAHVRGAFRAGPWSGNVGLQYIHQKQESSGSVINETLTPRVVEAVTDGASYNDVLPSLNLAYNLTDSQKLRLAVAKVMARPRMDEMRASFTPSFGKPCTNGQICAPGETVNPWSASGGNPKLEPWRATAFDLSYEWYFSRASYVSVAAFYKDLKSYIFNQHFAFDFSGFPIPPDGLEDVPAGVTVSSIGQVDKPANGKGGNIRGFELSGSLELGKVVEALDGFGIQGSFSRTLSDLHPLEVANDGSNEDSVKTTRIPGLSGRVYNLTGYYEKYGFQARASYRFRSAFKGEVVQLFAVRGVTEILDDKQLDAQIGYTFPEGTRMENLSILLQVNNVTDSPYRTRLGTDGGGPRAEDGAFLPETYETYGRQYLFGVGYRF